MAESSRGRSGGALLTLKSGVVVNLNQGMGHMEFGDERKNFILSLASIFHSLDTSPKTSAEHLFF
jgi:hypothetical protein